jgi:predicted Holliday junction resolvase-like endonuclease
MNTLLSQNLILIAGMVLLLAAAALFLVIGLKIGAAFGRRRERADWEGGKLEGIVRDRLNRSRAVLGGLASEQVAPFLPGFPFDPGDCRFVGKPVDFVVFKGMNQKDITEVIFLEVKSGTSKTLNDQEKKLRDAVNAGKVRWEEFDVPEV